MRIFPYIFGLFATQALAAVSFSDVKKGTTTPFVSNRFIIEVDDVSAFAPNQKRGAHEALYASLRARDITFEVVKEFNVQGIFVGAAVVLDNAEDAVQVLSTEGVKAIRPVRKFDRPQYANLPPDYPCLMTADILHAGPSKLMSSLVSTILNYLQIRNPLTY